VSAEVAYVGSKGVNLNGMTNLNTFSTELFNKVQANYPGYNTAIQTKGFGSNYNSLQVKVRKTTAHGLSFLAAYTWSHALAEASNDFTPQETVRAGIMGVLGAGEFRRFQANAGFDVRHRVSVAGVYELPWGRDRKWGRNWNGFADKTLGGWNLNFIVTAQSGFPYSVYDPSRVLPNRVCDGNLPKGERTVSQWFDFTCFEAVPFPETGNSAPNIITGPGYSNWDLGIHKVTSLTEKTRLEFRMEAFNIWNHPQLIGPTLSWFDNNLAGAEITQARDSRSIQFALRLSF
jgi:hypothetical protein